MELDNQQQAGTNTGGPLSDAEATLTHAKELLQSAVTHLLRDALEIRIACFQQKLALKKCVDSAQQREPLLTLSKTIEDGANNLIMHLQFQDMVTQLLDHVQSSLSALEGGSSRDKGQAQGDGSVSGGADQDTKNKPVTSRDMQAGDVELF